MILYRSVDVATYGFNMLAERAKDRDHLNTITSRFYIEVLIPIFAILTLFSVTIYFTLEAIEVLQNSNRGDDNINVMYLYGFSGANLVIDITCVAMFCCRGRDVFIEKKEFLPQLSLDTSIDDNDDDDDMDEFGRLDDDIYKPNSLIKNTAGISNNNKNDSLTTNASTSSTLSFTNNSITSTEISSKQEKKNLNMMSAFAHVSGDSLRTISVLVAAIVSTVTGASVDACDAWAAIVVSLMIVVFMLPLLIDIIKAGIQLYKEKLELDFETRYERVAHEDDITI